MLTLAVSRNTTDSLAPPGPRQFAGALQGSTFDRPTERSVLTVAVAVLGALVLTVFGPIALTVVQPRSGSSTTTPGSTASAAGDVRSAQTPPPAVDGPALDVDAVVDAARRRVVADPHTPGVLTADDPRYTARFDASGYSVAPPSAAGEPGFSVSLRAMHRTGPIAVAPADWVADGNVANRVVAPGVTERVTVRESEVEWDVILDRAPAGTGDLTIEAGVSGTPVAHDSSSSTLAWSVDGHVVTVGEMVVKDAGGQEVYRNLPRVISGGLALDVPASVVDGAVYPLTVDPVVTPEYPLSTPTAAPGDQVDPVVAFDGTNHLVVWVEAAPWPSTVTDIGAARVAPDGTVLDLNSIMVTDDGVSRNPAVAFDGVNFLVVFEVGDPMIELGVSARRISPSGIVVDRSAIVIAAGLPKERNFSGIRPSVASDGTNSLVVWGDDRSGNRNVAATRVSRAGAVLDAGGLVVAGGAGDQREGDVVFNGTNYVVSWSGAKRLAATRVARDGRILDPSGVTVAQTVDFVAPVLTVAGPNVLAVWSDNKSFDEDVDIYGARISPAGVVLDPNRIHISDNPAHEYLSDVVFDGTNALVAWRRQLTGSVHEVRGARLTTSGVVLDVGGIALAPASDVWEQQSLSLGGTDVLMVSNPRGETGTDIYGVTLSGTGRLPQGETSLISTRLRRARTADVVFDGTNHLVVWEDMDSPGQTQINGTLVGRSGEVTQLSLTSNGGIPSRPSVSFDGTNFFVVWHHNKADGRNDIYGARVARDGTVLDPGGFVISAEDSYQSGPAVSFDGTNHVVVWHSEVDLFGSRQLDLWAARVTPQGSVLPAFSISQAAGNQYAASIASDGAGSLIVWQDNRSGTYDIQAKRLPSGTGSSPSPLFTISSAAGDQLEPSVAWNGNRYLVAWGDGRSGTTADIYGTRVTTGNVVLDRGGLVIARALGDQSDPDVATNGSMFLLAWTDRRSGEYSDIYGGRVDDSGAVRDGEGFQIAADGPSELLPVVASGSEGKWFAAYVRTSATVDGAQPNNSIFHRMVSPK